MLLARRPLLPILAMQAVVSIATLRNTAFQDEGLYLYAGRQIVRHWMGGPAPLDHYAYYFSGYPYVYPVIGGFLDRIGGLELARSFSLLCMLGVTAIVYSMTQRVFDRPAAVFASAAYATTGVVLFVGRLATFDALCLFFIALATGIGVHSGTTKRSWTVLAVGPAMVAAILAKYAAGLFIPPVFSVLAYLSVVYLGWKRAIARVFLGLASFAASLGVAYLIVDKQAFHALDGSTTGRETFLKAARLDLFTHVLQMGGILFGIALVGLALLFRRRRFRLFAVILFVSAWLAPIYHIYMHEPISLDKHIAYGLFFAVPVAGYALAWLSGYERPTFSSNRAYWLGGVAMVLVILTVGLRQSQTLFSNWANTSKLSYALHTQLRDGTGRILAEDIEVARYDARDVTEEWQWNSFYYPYYVDATGHEWLGNEAVTRALKDRYYDFIELSFNYFPEQAYFLAGQMAAQRNYDLIAIVPFTNSYGKGHYYVWRSALVPGHGDFKGLDQLRMNVWP